MSRPRRSFDLTSQHHGPSVLSRRRITWLAITGAFIPKAFGFGLDAPNVVEISPTLLTSGQPSANALARLASLGIEAVVYLAPSTVPDAVPEEAHLLGSQGIAFIHIPIPFPHPQEEHFLAVSRSLERLKARKTLVHCQVNMRASTMVFLHRVIALREDPAQAYEAVLKVWSPTGAWRRLMLALLKQNQIEFEPL